MSIIVRNYYYNRLSTEEREIYGSIVSAMSQGESKVNVGEISSTALSNIDSIITAVFWDNPQFVAFTEIGITKYETPYVFLNSCPVDMGAYMSAYQTMLAEILNSFCSTDTLWSKCKKIYDYLAKSLVYDWKTYNENKDASYHHSFSSYGLVVDKKGVCMGIAKLFKIICDDCEIPCICVPAELINESNQYDEHMLNIVEVIEGNPGYVDVTTGLADEYFPYPKYDCFLESTKVAEKSYNLNTDIYCDSNDQSFLYLNHLVFANQFDLRTYLEGYSIYSNQGIIRFRYSGAVLTKKELEKLLYGCIDEHLTRDFKVVGHFFKSDFGCCYIDKTMED